MTKKAKTPQNTTSLAPVIFIFCFTIIYIVTGYMTLDEDSRHVPILTGYVTIFLLIFETLKRFVVVKSEKQPEAEIKSDEDPVNVSILRELTGLLYVAGLAMTIYFFGFFVAIPVYLFVAIVFLGKQSKKTAIIVTTIASIIIYIVFEVLRESMRYQGRVWSFDGYAVLTPFYNMTDILTVRIAVYFFRYSWVNFNFHHHLCPAGIQDPCK